MRELSTLERITLFVCAMYKAEASELLAGLSDDAQARAHVFAHEIQGWDSPTRQARLTREFGPRANALDRVKRLITEAPPALRVALAQQLPPTMRASFPQFKAQPLAPALEALAARLIREATR